MRQIDIPNEWKEAKKEILNKLGKVFVLGKTDSGKTTFALYLLREAIQSGFEVALLDSDVGQSTIGPPTTIGLKFYKSFKDLESFKADHLYFVGDTSPRYRYLEMIVGTRKLLEKACENAPDLVIIDSCGLISPPLGLNLKLQKIELTEPDFVILFNHEETAPIEKALCHYKYTLLTLPSSPKARLTSIEERKNNREKSFQFYFKKAKEITLALNEVSIYPDISGPGKSEAELTFNVVGLFNFHHECKGIGTTTGINFAKSEIKVFTPLKETEKICGLKFGSLKITPEGKELNRQPFKQ